MQDVSLGSTHAPPVQTRPLPQSPSVPQTASSLAPQANSAESEPTTKAKTKKRDFNMKTPSIEF
jgi:hypothetical protein